MRHRGPVIEEYRRRLGASGPSRLLADLADMLAFGGYILCTPTASLMGFRCSVDEIRAEIVAGRMISARQHSRSAGDCWFVWFAQGSMKEILSMIPDPLKNVAFSRRGVVRVWELQRLITRANHVPESIPIELAERSP